MSVVIDRKDNYLIIYILFDAFSPQNVPWLKYEYHIVTKMGENKDAEEKK